MAIKLPISSKLKQNGIPDGNNIILIRILDITRPQDNGITQLRDIAGSCDIPKYHMRKNSISN